MITSQDIKKSLSSEQKVCLVGPLVKNYRPKLMPHLLVDGGVKIKPELKNIPHWSIGDGDSSHSKLDIMLNKDKDYSDLKAALRCLPLSIKEVYLKGFLGGRKDHELLNFGEVHHFLKNKKQVRVYFSNKVKAYSAGIHDIKIKGSFSLLVFESAKVAIKGDVKYPLRKKHITPLSSLTLSNFGSGAINIDSNGPFYIFLN